MSKTKRKGSRSTKDIPPDVLRRLNKGEIETASLVEWMAIDQCLLLENLLEQNGRLEYLKPILTKIARLEKQTVNTRNEAAGTGIFAEITKNNDDDFLAIMSQHRADSVRSWATYSIGNDQSLNMTDTLAKIRIFAADKHFMVREVSWFALRAKIAQHLIESIDLFSGWTTSQDENIRRFASEATRPCGVWCKHIKELKESPELALAILDPLKNDCARYVQNSVGNWLNDASKTNPAFVTELCRRWVKQSDTAQTAYIIRRALRTIQK